MTEADPASRRRAAEVTEDAHAGGVGRDDEHRHALVGARVGIRHGHEEDQLGLLRARREELVAVDDPLVAVADRLTAEPGRVGAAVRLGHREDHRDLALEQRIEPTLLLLVRAEHGEHVRLAAARRPGAGREDVGRPVRAADHLVEEGQVHFAEALPTLLGRQVGGVELLVLHLLAPLLEELSDRALRPTDVDHVVEQRLDRLDLLGHEAIGPIELRLHVGVGAEVPCHRQILPDTCAVTDAATGASPAQKPSVPNHVVRRRTDVSGTGSGLRVSGRKSHCPICRRAFAVQKALPVEPGRAFSCGRSGSCSIRGSSRPDPAG